MGYDMRASREIVQGEAFSILQAYYQNVMPQKTDCSQGLFGGGGENFGWYWEAVPV